MASYLTKEDIELHQKTREAIARVSQIILANPGSLKELERAKEIYESYKKEIHRR